MDKVERDLDEARILRRKAEKLLKETQKTENSTVEESDGRKLLHELQVHQIELEMQNAELQQANLMTEAALKKYTMLYEFAPVGYLTLDSGSSICELNITAAEMLGDRRFALVNSNFRLFVAEESRAEFDRFYRKVYSGFTKESCRVRLGYDNHPLCYAYLEGIVTGDERNCLLSVVDISGFCKHPHP